MPYSAAYKENSPASVSSIRSRSSSNFTPLPVVKSRLPLPRPTMKRASSPTDCGVDNENENPSSQQLQSQATPSPSKRSISEIVKQRFSSLSPSPLKVRSAIAGGIFSSSSSAQTTRRVSLGGGSGGSSLGNSNNKLNAYSIRSDMSPNKMNTPAARRKSTLNTTGEGTDRIKVCVRKRPLSTREVQSNHQDILEMNSSGQCVSVLEGRVKLDGISKYIEKHEFVFDRAFDVDSTNHQIYSSCVQELVDTVISGGRATCFAYGQTGSGKTHTMLNPGDGLNYLAAQDLIEQTYYQLSNVSISVTFYEIYQNSLYDLLNQKRRVMACEGKDGEVHIVGITEVPVSSVQNLQEIMTAALNTRSTGSTAANSSSSRSHAILQFVLRRPCGGIHGKFSFIDLAGSERGSDRANVDKQTKLEGAEINKSLLALKECIRAIDQDSSHLPFRQSKLTLVLKDSFTGNAKTCMIATVSPSSGNCEHTINTLRYADRVKELKGPSNLFIEQQDTPPTTRKTSIPQYIKELTTPTKVPLSPLVGNNRIRNETSLFADEDETYDYEEEINSYLSSSPIKLTESDDSFLLNSISTNGPKSSTNKPSKQLSVEKLKEKLHQSIAILYDRVSNCQDADLLELLGEEMEGLLAAFNK